MVRTIPNQITNRELHGAALVGVREGVDGIIATGDRDGIKADHRIGRTRTVDGEGTALQSDRISRRHPGWGKIARRVEPVVIPIQRTIIEIQPSRAANRTRISQLQDAAADGGRTRVSIRVRQSRRIRASAGEVNISGDNPAEGGRSDGRGSRQLSDRREIAIGDCTTGAGKRIT